MSVNSVEFISAANANNINGLSPILDHNFNVLQENLDNENDLISFLDSVHIVKEYKYDNSDKTYSDLIADFGTEGATLNNYEALIINTINYNSNSADANQPSDNSFKISGYTGAGDSVIKEGRIVIRLPNGGGLIINGLSQVIFTPSYTDGVVTYTVSENPGTQPASVPVSICIATNIAPVIYCSVDDWGTGTSPGTSSVTLTYSGSSFTVFYPRFYTKNNDQIIFENEISMFTKGTKALTLTAAAATNMTAACVTKVIIEVA